MCYYIACQKSQNWLEPVRESSEKKEKHVQLLLNVVLSFEFKFPTTRLPGVGGGEKGAFNQCLGAGVTLRV